MAGNYTTGGVLFHNNQKKNDKEPDVRGNLEVDRAIVDDLIEQLKSNTSAVIDIAGWRRQGAKGEFFGMSPSIPFKKDGGGQSRSGGSGGGSVGQGKRTPPIEDIDDEIPF